jgi:asparagine synthase (glutamine-hydrolysing)
MNGRANAHGFVVRYGSQYGAGAPISLDVRRGAAEGSARSDELCLLVRPLATTPEAVHEQQPIVTPHAVLVYAGHIDNRGAISSSLGLSGASRMTDGELLVEAYAAWGSEFPANVLGEYSFALVDRTKNRLVAGRDSLGFGRLFRYEDSNSIWMASSLELLLSALPGRPPFDREALAEYFAGGGLLTSGRTIYEGVRELPAAHVMVRRKNSTVIQRYWQPDPERRLALHGTDEYDEAFRSLLFEAVRASLRANTKVWSDLSGGLDSSTVTAVAALLQRDGQGPEEGLGAFSLFASQTASSDESAYQAEFLASYPLEHQAIDIDQYPSFGIDEPPSCHPSKAILYRPLWNAVSTLFDSRGVGTHLTGRGGDNILCGDDFPPLHLAELLRELRWTRWMRETREWAQQGQRSLWNLLWHCSRGELTDLYAGAQTGSAPAWLTPRFREAAQSAESEPWRAGPRLYSSPARELQYRSITQTSAVVRFIRVGDERHPLLYRPLVEFLLATPWEHLLRPTESRVIQRRALRGILPDGIRTRTSKSSGTPVLLRGLRENWHKIHRLTTGRRIAELDLAEPQAFQAACERMRHGLLGGHLRYLAGAISLELWLSANEVPQRDNSIAAHFSGLGAHQAPLYATAAV